MKGPVEEGLSVVVAQPLDVETTQRLRWQAEHERERGSATCRAVVAVVRKTDFFFHVEGEVMGSRTTGPRS